MDEASAIAIVDHVRRFTDGLLMEVRRLKGQVSPAELKVWHSRFGKALGGLDNNILRPIERVHPQAIPVSMGGRGPKRSLKKTKK